MIDALIFAVIIVIGGGYLTAKLEIEAQEEKHHDAHNH